MTEHQRIHPPFSQPASGRRAPQQRTMVPGSDYLPPIERYADDLPEITQFLVDDSGRVPASGGEPHEHARRDPPQAGRVEMNDEGWAAADWQSYDWNRLAALGAPPPEAAAANADWSSTDWGSGDRSLRDVAVLPGHLGGLEVAAALDEIARRIRTGELSLEQFRGSPPEAAIAAVFAAFLRSRG